MMNRRQFVRATLAGGVGVSATGCLDNSGGGIERNSRGDSNFGGAKTFSTPDEYFSGNTAPNSEMEGVYERQYTQETDGHRTTLRMTLPKALYEYYDARHRLDNNNIYQGNANPYGQYVADQYQSNIVREVAEYFVSYGRENNLSRREIIDQVIGFVQQLEYTTDRVNNGFENYPQYPYETLVLRSGDCEDSSILTAALLKQLGYDVILLLMPNDEHMAVGVKGENLPGTYYGHRGNRFYYLEATAPYRVGEVPSGVKDGRARFLEVRNVPVLVFRWVAVPQENSMDVRADIRNVGDGSTDTAQIQAELFTQSGRVDYATSRRQNLRPNQTASTELQLTTADAQEVKMRVSVLTEGDLHDMDESRWQRI